MGLNFNENYLKNNLYISSFDVLSSFFGIFSAVCGLALLMLSKEIYEFDTICALFGILLIIIGIASVVYCAKEVVGHDNDALYDERVKNMKIDLKGRGLEKLGLDESQVQEAAPIYIEGYEFVDGAMVRRGKDKKWRSNKYKTVQLYFSADDINIYTHTFTTTKESNSEVTDVYFYKDIVSITTSLETTKINNLNIEYECFKIITTGGTALSVSLRDKESAEQSIQAMRALLREKKGQ